MTQDQQNAWDIPLCPNRRMRRAYDRQRVARWVWLLDQFWRRYTAAVARQDSRP